jgi:hypothetical protein
VYDFTIKNVNFLHSKPKLRERRGFMFQTFSTIVECRVNRKTVTFSLILMLKIFIHHHHLFLLKKTIIAGEKRKGGKSRKKRTAVDGKYSSYSHLKKKL